MLDTIVLRSKRKIDPDLSPENEQNKEAARGLGLYYDPECRIYRDRDGYPALDRFGQSLG